MARSWPPVDDDAQKRARDALCTALKADQPAERLLGGVYHNNLLLLRRFSCSLLMLVLARLLRCLSAQGSIDTLGGTGK